MEQFFEIAVVPIIVALVYFIMELYKIVVKENEKWMRLIPVFAAGFGIVLGIVAYFVEPEIIAAENVFVAALIGGASGFAATGVNQVFKQLGKTTTTQEADNDQPSKTES